MFRISGFYDEAAADLGKQIALIKKLGGKYLCPRLLNGKNIADFSADEFERDILPVLSDAGIRLSSLGSPAGKINIDDADAYAAQKKKLAELIKIAGLADCKYIRCFSFFTGGADTDGVRNKVLDKWRGFLELAEGSGVTLLHENEKKIFGDIPERALWLYVKLSHPQFKLCYDASNYIQCGADPWAAYEATREYTVYYHMKDCIDGVETPLGMGRGRIADIIKDLNERGYDGFLTLEPHTAKYALLKKAFYILPFLRATRYGRVFGMIDKAAGIKPLETVSREDVFVWQYENLVKIIKNVGGKYE
ncbi:MAG: sugar phosphate isomerase/epimerase [Clostridiales bacterium]|jgi:sugar phosphate isomerase/epimerase|nr:sugar phosphate isomerase/epimerase [Clostridiales bacterium]